jgi:hypothetical protein
MNSLMLINSPRKKQPYLVNPVNPWRKITVPKHRFAIWQDNKSKRFAKPPAWALSKKPHFRKRKIKLSRKSHTGHKYLLTKRHTRIISPFKPTDIKAMERQFIRLSSHRPKSHKGAKSMKTRHHRKHAVKHHRKHRRTHSNPFSLKGMTRGFADTGMLIDGSLVVGGMLVTTLAMDFASSKVAFLSTPVGKGLGKLGVAFLVQQGGKMLKINSRYTNMIAIGVIASAVKDVAEIVLPKLGYTGGVKLLGFGSGYGGPQLPSLSSTGYSPDNTLASGDESDGDFAFSG